MRPVKRDGPVDEIRSAIRALMRLSLGRLVQRGYARDSAKDLLMSMTRGIMGHLDDQETKGRRSTET
jgi:hypothetical protein